MVLQMDLKVQEMLDLDPVRLLRRACCLCNLRLTSETVSEEVAWPYLPL